MKTAPVTIIIMFLFITAALWAWVLTTPAPQDPPRREKTEADCQQCKDCCYVIGFSRDCDLSELNNTLQEPNIVGYALHLNCYGAGGKYWIEVTQDIYGEYKKRYRTGQSLEYCFDRQYFAAN
jgi:hypothetical protein